MTSHSGKTSEDCDECIEPTLVPKLSQVSHVVAQDDYVVVVSSDHGRQVTRKWANLRSLIDGKKPVWQFDMKGCRVIGWF